MERSESRWRDEGKGEAIPFQISDNAERFAAGLLVCWLGALDDDVVFNSQFTINKVTACLAFLLNSVVHPKTKDEDL